MRTCTAAIALLAVLAASPAATAGGPPRHLGGFTLGQPISEVADRVDMETALPVRYMEALREVEIRPTPGFRSGLIAYGSCARPGRILRIKLKYADDSRAFYDDLLERFTDRFGKPTEWAGDPFHVVMDWKWSFQGPDGQRVSLHLSHNHLDREEKFGNAVKMTLVDGIEADVDCFNREHPHFKRPSGETADATPLSWETLIPQ